MDIKRVLQVLLRDIADLQQFVEEVKNEASLGATDLELIHTRLSGIMHMLERSAEGVGELQRQLNAAEHRAEALAAVKIPASEVVKVETEVSKMAETPVAQPAVKVPKVAGVRLAEVALDAAVSEDEVAVIPAEVLESVAVVETKEMDVPVQESSGDGVDLVEISGDHPVLGEKFIQGKSLNDLLVEQSKGDSKYSHMPITNLQAAVGINDRFLFTRELFDGSAQHYQETMARLDGMQNLQEAAAFLRATYTWKKSDTSLKFIELVRRRFQ